MSWKFAGIIFKNECRGSYPDLLKRLQVNYCHSAEGFTFSDAIARQNESIAVASVGACTMLLHHFLPYDCSYEAGKEGRLDEILGQMSEDGDIMNFIIDGVSETYCFSLFVKGKRVRRRAVEPGKVWCDEGVPLDSEALVAAGKNSTAGVFTVCENETKLVAVVEAFLGLSFQELVNSDQPLFHFFL